MALEFRFYKDELADHFFGRCITDGKAKVYSLETKIDGIPPMRNGRPSLFGEGDVAFEISRAQAEVELKERAKEDKQKGRADHLTARLIESKTGKKVEYVKLSDLAQQWRAIPRDEQPSEPWFKWCDTVFKRFADKTPKTFLYEVTQEEATAYGETLRKDFTSRTASGAESLLKSAFTHLLPPGMKNPFEKVISNRSGSNNKGAIHRRPLTADQLVTLFETARPDPLLYSLTVCAACTGMRIGDVCLLQWQSVDLRADYIFVTTGKTGTFVEIPIFKPLREVLEMALAEKGESPYVWPHAASMYQKTKEDDGKKITYRGYGITYRGKSLFARAFASKTETPQDVPENGQIGAEKPDLAKILPKVLEAVRGAGFTQEKEARIVDTLTRYARGESYNSIEKETGRKRPIISQDLHDAEIVSKLRLRRGLIGVRGTRKKSGRDLKTLITATRQTRSGSGVLSASLLGWHSLRGTFVTLALAAGVPIETVGKITGHALAETIRKHYNNPQREHLRAVLGDKLPEVLTGKPKQAAEIKTKGNRVQEIAKAFGELSEEEKLQLAKMLAPQKSTVRTLPAKRKNG
jgi:integrase